MIFLHYFFKLSKIQCSIYDSHTKQQCNKNEIQNLLRSGISKSNTINNLELSNQSNSFGISFGNRHEESKSLNKNYSNDDNITNESDFNNHYSDKQQSSKLSKNFDLENDKHDIGSTFLYKRVSDVQNDLPTSSNKHKSNLDGYPNKCLIICVLGMMICMCLNIYNNNSFFYIVWLFFFSISAVILIIRNLKIFFENL